MGGGQQGRTRQRRGSECFPPAPLLSSFHAEPAPRHRWEGGSAQRSGAHLHRAAVDLLAVARCNVAPAHRHAAAAAVGGAPAAGHRRESQHTHAVLQLRECIRLLACQRVNISTRAQEHRQGPCRQATQRAAAGVGRQQLACTKGPRFHHTLRCRPAATPWSPTCQSAGGAWLDGGCRACVLARLEKGRLCLAHWPHIPCLVERTTQAG